MYAASIIVRVKGPTVSWVCEIGTTRYLLVNPTEGLIPVKLFLLEGEIIEPDVSVPTAAAAKPMDETTPGPLLDPDGSCIG
jgi:hypothetical protein